MIHIIKNNAGKFEVVTISNSRSRQYLSGTNQGFERRSGSVKNIRAQMKVWGIYLITVQDDTLSPSKILTITPFGSWYQNDDPCQPYKPKN